jgi:hypothetical protein
MSTFFHQTFAVAERKSLTLDEICERVAASIEHPFVASRAYVREAGVEWVRDLLTARGRKAVDRQRSAPYRWETGLTSSEPAKAFFLALYRPGYLPEAQVIKHLGAELGQIAIDAGRAATGEDLAEIFALPTMNALYKLASVVRAEERYADLPRRREWSPTEAQEREIVEMLEVRRPYADIAKSMGTTVSTIREHIRQNKLGMPAKRGRRTDKDRNDAIIQEYANGVNTKDLSEKYGLTRVRIYQIVGDVTSSDTAVSFKARVRNLFSSHPSAPNEVECAIQTILAWAEEK